MLDRIGNISLEVDFNKSRKGKYSSFKGGLYDNSTFDINDSISFSPASKFLSRANWILREFQHPADDKIIVEFIYGGFYFEANLDIQSVSSMETINYIIRKEESFRLENNPTIATFRIATGSVNEAMPLQKELKGLFQLFQRFSALDLKSELNIYNYELIDTLLDGIYSSLQSDFAYLNNILINFLEKQTNKKLNVLFNKVKKSTEVNLLKIKPYLIK